jgi:hypothetical protein
MLCFWKLSIVLSLSKSTVPFIFQTTIFRRLILSRSVSPEIGTSSIDWTQLSRFYLKTETELSITNFVF